MQIYKKVLLLTFIFNCNASDYLDFINKAIPTKNDLKNNNHFFFQLFKNQKNEKFLKIKQIILSGYDDAYTFLNEQKLSEHADLQNVFFTELIYIKKLLLVSKFCKISEKEKKEKQIEKIKNEIKNDKKYKKALEYFNKENSDEEFYKNQNIGYARYIDIKLNSEIDPTLLTSQFNKQNTNNIKKTNKLTKISCLLLMITAVSILIYFLMLTQSIEINNNKEIIKTIKIINPNGEVTKGIPGKILNKKELPPKKVDKLEITHKTTTTSETQKVKNKTKEEKIEKDNIQDYNVENVSEEDPDNIEEEIFEFIAPESSCF